MTKRRVWLIIRADESIRVVSRLPRLRMDEVGVAIDVTFPAGWGRIVQPEVQVIVPDSNAPFPVTVPDVEAVRP